MILRVKGDDEEEGFGTRQLSSSSLGTSSMLDTALSALQDSSLIILNRPVTEMRKQAQGGGSARVSTGTPGPAPTRSPARYTKALKV